MTITRRPRLRWAPFIAALLLIVCAIPGRSASALDLWIAPDHIVKQAWQTDQGLPQVSVTSIVQTRDGYIWMGTFGGLARFDGVRFTVFDSGNTPGLVGNRILSLLEDRDGVLWIGTESGASRVERGRFAPVSVPTDALTSGVISIAQDGSGTMWLGTRRGVVAIRDGAIVQGPWERFNGGVNRVILHVGSSGTMWAAVGGRLYEVRDATFTEVALDGAAGHGLTTGVFEAQDGSVWVGTDSSTWRRSSTGQWNEILASDAHGHLGSASIAGARDGTVILGTGQGISRWRDGHVRTDQATSAGDHVRAAIEDREGGLWIGTDSGGLQTWRPARVTALGPEEGLPDGGVVPVLEDHAGNMWIAAVCGGLYKFSGGFATQYRVGKDLTNGCVWALAEDQTGDIWVGTFGGGVGKFSNGRFVERYSRQSGGLVGDGVNALYVDRDHAVWVGAENGVSRIAGGRVETVDLGTGPSGMAVRFITQDRSGAMWIAGTGVIRIKDGQRTAFTTRDGLSDNAVRAIHEDADGVLWIGTYGGGLNRFKDGRFTRYTTREGLFDNTVSQILEDDHGHLWLSGNAGISRLSKQDLNDLADGRATRLDVVTYGVAEGMKSRETNGGGQPAGWRSRDGHLWFPTVRGVVTLDPNQLLPAPPPVIIEQAFANTGPINLSDAQPIGPGVTDLALTFTALAYDNPSNTRFKYRLDGHDTDWVDAGNRRQAYYTNLRPGPYRFHVIARNSDGVWNTEGATADFYVRPYFYQTTWFALFVGLILSGSAWGGYRLSVSRLRARADALSQLVDQRTQAEEALRRSHDELASTLGQLRQAQQDLVQQERLRALGQMAGGVAHDINNALAPILGYSDLLLSESDLRSDPTELVEKLGIINTAAADAAGVVRRLLDFSRRRQAGSTFPPVRLHDLVAQVILLTHPRWKTEAQARGVPIAIETELAPVPPVSADESELREAVVNLVFNAVEAMPAGGTLRFTTRTDGDLAVLVVSDTGVGMDEEVRRRCFEPFFSRRKSDRGTGLGLASVFGTVQRFGGRIEVDSAPGQGSTFTIWLPTYTKIDVPDAPPNRPATVAPLRVLLVEDEPRVRELIASFLGSDGHRVDMAENGRAGLDRFSVGAYDLVVTDRAMPVMSGDQMAHDIRRLDPDVPIILISGYGDIMKATGELPYGVTLVLGKPVTLGVFRDAIVEARRRHARS